jgi:serine/threonine-protein kinase
LSAEGLAPTHLGVPIGTPAFMSPEQAAGKLDALGPASDVYSLGATLYCLLTGQPPFAGQDVNEVLGRVQRADFPPPRVVKAGVPAALEAVCLKAMALRPADRYGTARALADDVVHRLADEPVAAHREPWPARLARWGRRHRPLVAAALALLAVVMLAVGVVVVNRERQAAEAARTRTRQALDEMSSQVIEDWLAQKKQLEPAQRAFLEKALGYYEDFAGEAGHGQEVRQGVAGAHRRVGNIRSQLGQHPEAEAAYARARELYARLAADFPAEPLYRREVARTHNNLGNLLKATGRPREAEAAYREARDLYKALAKDFLAVPDSEAELANTLDSLAKLARDRKDHLSARRLLEEARPSIEAALGVNSRHPFYLAIFSEHRRILALTLLDLGEHAGAAAAAAELARVAFDPAGDAYKAAGFLSRCVPLAEKDAKLPEARRQELARSYGDRALEALRQAVAKGYKDAAQMKKDTDLDAVRGRDDFQKLLAEVEAGAKPEQKKGP